MQINPHTAYISQAVSEFYPDMSQCEQRPHGEDWGTWTFIVDFKDTTKEYGLKGMFSDCMRSICSLCKEQKALRLHFKG